MYQTRKKQTKKYKNFQSYNMKKIIEYVIKTEDLDLEGTGVDIMSLVENPAIQVDFLAFADVLDPMISGIITILLQIEDLDNRASVLDEIILDLENEGIPYDIEDLRQRAGLAALQPYVDETGRVLREECSDLIEEDFAKIGPRGGVVKSPKAPGSIRTRNPKGKGTSRGDASNTRSAEVSKKAEETLQKKSDDFNERYKDKLGYGTSIGMLKAVYQRGKGAYNTSRSPVVNSSEQWAQARVNAFLYLVKTGRPEKKGYKQDNDLLPAKHPKSEKSKSSAFAEGMPHYTADGKLYDGPTHKDAGGRLMTGEVHGDDSEYLYHYDELPENIEDLDPEYRVKSRFESYNDYPEAAKANAQRALNWVDKNGWGSCGTPVGKARANQLAKGENISVDTIKRMASFARQRQNSSTPYGEGCGGLMWDAWGGDAGVDWASRKLKQLENEKLTSEEQSIIDFLRVRGEEIHADAVFVQAHKSSFSTLGDFLKGITALDILGRRGVDSSDTEGVEVYRYAGPPAQRGFCMALQRLNKVYRQDDMASSPPTPKLNEITSLNTANPGFGKKGSNKEYSVFDYKGGVNCTHYWEKLMMFKDGRETVFISQGPANGKAGKSNNAAEPSPDGAVANNARVNFSVVEDQRIVVGPAMIPNKMIKRVDEETGATYHVYFSKGTIKDISEDFLAKANLNNTNIEHEKDTLTKKNTLLESWIVSDPQNDKSNTYGMSMPEGTWMVSYRINDDDTWRLIKEGKLRGLSVEGYFVDRASVTRN